MKRLKIIFPILITILILVPVLYVYISNKTGTKNILAAYGLTPTHPKFQRVVVTVDGCDGDLDRTINSVLSQNVRVSEIATDKKTCNVSNMCESVLNRYSDPYNKGVVKSTFERELDADTVVVFIKRGYAFPDTGSLRSMLDKWTESVPIKTENVSIMNAAQC
jgi:hypothetical protein